MEDVGSDVLAFLLFLPVARTDVAARRFALVVLGAVGVPGRHAVLVDLGTLALRDRRRLGIVHAHFALRDRRQRRKGEERCEHRDEHHGAPARRGCDELQMYATSTIWVTPYTAKKAKTYCSAFSFRARTARRPAATRIIRARNPPTKPP